MDSTLVRLLREAPPVLPLPLGYAETQRERHRDDPRLQRRERHSSAIRIVIFCSTPHPLRARPATF